MSLGGACALHSSYDSPVRSTSVIAAPLSTWRYLERLPPSNITALHQLTGATDRAQLLETMHGFDVTRIAPRITVPVRIFHGQRDGTIPVSEAWALAEAVSGPVAVTIFERDHHNCLEHFHDIIAMTLEWFADPGPIANAWLREQNAARAERDAAAAARPNVRRPTLPRITRTGGAARGEDPPLADAALGSPAPG
jgi:hypothetical protein